MANELFTAGEILTAAKLNRIAGTGTPVAFTPALTQSVTVTKTVEYAGYKRFADLVMYYFSLAVTGAGTAGQPIRVGTPPLNQIPFRILGGAYAVYDASVGLWYHGAPLWAAANLVSGQGNGLGTPLGQAGMTAALAAGDIVSGHIWYFTNS